MRTPTFTADALTPLFQRESLVTLNQLQAALGHPARSTVFRKLAELEYLSSYSHRGQYYTLRSIARFTPQGLWSCRSVWFSRFGNLLDTATALVDQSRTGFTDAELRAVLHVKTKHALAQLVRQRRLRREVINRVFVYFSADRQAARRQQEKRRAYGASPASLVVTNPDLAVAEAKATILLFYSLLDEKQRRLYAGLESLKLGHGGDAHIASLLEIDPHTVARGRQELLAGEIDPQRVRSKGGGRPSQEKKRRKS